MKCDIIIPVWNQLEVTRECIDSILKTTDHPYRLIVIDNGSDTATADYLKSLKAIKGPDYLLIRNEKNLGFVKAVNQGMKESKGPCLCIMNNDTIATPGWLTEMMSIMESRKDIGLLNPSSNTSGQFPENGESIDDYASRLKQYKGHVQELYTCRGFCMLLRREVVDKLGLLDEVYHIGYFDDTDYCKRAQLAGYRTARAKAAYVYHKENVSFKSFDNNEALFADNEKIFFDRWGRSIRVGYFIDKISSREKIDRIATDVARNGHQILIFFKKGLPWPVTLDHFDIRRIDLGGILFSCLSFYKILKRKKKKKLDVLLTDNRGFGAFLNMTKVLHGSEVIIEPDKDILLKMLKEKSRIN